MRVEMPTSDPEQPTEEGGWLEPSYSNLVRVLESMKAAGLVQQRPLWPVEGKEIS